MKISLCSRKFKYDFDFIYGRPSFMNFRFLFEKGWR